MIPKVIHYCWFGGKRKQKLIRDCIKSWKLYLPDYEIIEWNEKNSDLTHQFVNEAYRLKKWAFVADYIRLKVLYEYGGIYLDTDMLVLKTLNNLLEDKCFFGAEDKDFISCGIIGAEKKNNIIFDFLIQYDSIKILNNQKWDLIAMPILITKQIRQYFNFNKSFEKRIDFGEVVIYEIECFYPLPNKFKDDRLNYLSYLTPKTIAVHLWSASWVDHDEYYFIRNRLYFKAIYQIFKKIFVKNKFNLSYIKKILKELYNVI